MSSHDAESWLHSHGEAFLSRVGVRQGQCVLDFGCRYGQYALPAARVVGPYGCVYAVDKDAQALRTLRQKIRELKIANIYVSRVTRSARLPVPPETADVALVYDVLHGGYFPEAEQRVRLLDQVQAALKPGGLLSCYLTHVKRYGLTFRQLHREIGSAGFRLEGRARRRLVHDEKLVRGWIFRYRKTGASGIARRREVRARKKQTGHAHRLCHRKESACRPSRQS